MIPARLASSRLPGKVLADLGGRPVLEHVYHRALESGADSVVVATDTDEVADVARRFGARVVMTSSTHESGTDRIAEAATRLDLAPETIVVNLQGDEPQMPPAAIAAVAEALAAAPPAIATLALPIRTIAEFIDPNVVKVVTDTGGRALYFSRAPVPWPRDLVQDATSGSVASLPEPAPRRHVGLYGYRVAALTTFAALPVHPLERSERLEQLRALAHGMAIHVVEAPAPIPPGIDTPRDLEAARARHGGAF